MAKMTKISKFTVKKAFANTFASVRIIIFVVLLLLALLDVFTVDDILP
jgi:hypothetical protein